MGLNIAEVIHDGMAITCQQAHLLAGQLLAHRPFSFCQLSPAQRLHVQDRLSQWLWLSAACLL